MRKYPLIALVLVLLIAAGTLVATAGGRAKEKPEKPVIEPTSPSYVGSRVSVRQFPLYRRIIIKPTPTPTWERPSPGCGPGSTWDIDAGDMNGDGVPDVAIANYDYVGAVDGKTGTGLWLTYTGGGRVFGVAAGDVDGDGVADVAFSDAGGVGVLNGVDGSLIWYYATEDWAVDVAMGDVDGDGELEVVAGIDFLATTQDLIVFDGSTGVVEWLTYTGGNGLRDVLLVDLNGDGALDVVAGEYLSTNVYAYDVKNGGVLLWTGTVPGGVHYREHMSSGDLTGDGVPDVAIADHGGYVTVLDGATGATVTSQDTGTGQCMGSVVADIDADGIPEVVAACDGKVFAYDSLTWSVEKEIDTGLRSSGVAVANTAPLDTLQVVVTTYDEQVILLYGKDFTPIWSYTIPGGWFEDAVAFDADGDGFDEVTAAGNNASGVCDVVQLKTIYEIIGGSVRISQAAQPQLRESVPWVAVALALMLAVALLARRRYL
ncbi:MAG: hypothetical protein B6U73_04335 [Desulfurococcales archaeon ex4484_204]|nr:MAG: hypothetical protein B6U73_04335 [Desulfurococcales archaeon ex4484_204]